MRSWFDDPPTEEPFVSAIERQPNTTPIVLTPANPDRCDVHHRPLGYAEAKVGLCRWCSPEMFPRIRP